MDHAELGRRIRAARVLTGYDSMATFTAAIKKQTGLVVSDRSLYAVERGEQTVSWELIIALTIVLDSVGGMSFFYPAIEERHVRHLSPGSNQGLKRVSAR